MRPLEPVVGGQCEIEVDGGDADPPGIRQQPQGVAEVDRGVGRRKHQQDTGKLEFQREHLASAFRARDLRAQICCGLLG